MQKIQERKRPVFKSLNWRLTSIAIAAATTAIAIPVYHLLDGKTAQQTPLVAASEPKAVTASGRLEPKGEVIHLSASSTFEQAKVEQLLVKDGEQVKAGQVIAILDRRERLQAELAQSKQEVEVAQALLEQVKSGAKEGEIEAQKEVIARLEVELVQERKAQIAKTAGLEAKLFRERDVQEAKVAILKAELNNAQTECQRYESLFRQGVIANSTLDSKCLVSKTVLERLKEAEAARSQILETLQEQLNEMQASRNRTLESLLKQIREAKATLHRIQQVRPVDIKVAQTQVNSALAVVKKVQKELDLVYIRTFRDGKILKIYTYPGEVVGSEGIVELGQTEQMYAITEIYETDIGKVKLGKKATVISEFGGFTGELRGTVEEIGSKIGKQNILETDPATNVDVRVMEVKIKLNPEDSKRVANLTNLQVKVSIQS